MHNFGFALEGASRVLAAGLALGAGLPVLFALAIRSMARPSGRPIAYALLAVVVVAALLGIGFIVASGFGMKVSFEHLYPTVVPK